MTSGRKSPASEVNWTVPDSVLWTPPTADLRPQLTLAESAKENVEIAAEYGGSKATLLVSVAQGKPPSGMLSIVREPGGEQVVVGQRQRYTVVVNSGEQQTPGVGVEWQPAFENEYVRWEPPVLTAKQEGHQQQLQAAIGDQSVQWTTSTIAPPSEPSPSPPAGKPDQVRIVSDQPQPIVVPVRSEFADFRVEALYSGNVSHDVTRWATLSVESDDSQIVPVAVEKGRISAQRVGAATIQAQYNGVTTSPGLRVQVNENPAFDALEIQPSALELPVGETRPVRIVAYRGSGTDRKLIGDVHGSAIAQVASRHSCRGAAERAQSHRPCPWQCHRHRSRRWHLELGQSDGHDTERHRLCRIQSSGPTRFAWG